MTEAEQIRTLAEAHRIAVETWATIGRNWINVADPAMESAIAISQAIKRLADGIRSRTPAEMVRDINAGVLEYKEGP